MNPLQSRTTYEFSFRWPGKKDQTGIPDILSAERSSEGANCSSSPLGALNAQPLQKLRFLGVSRPKFDEDSGVESKVTSSIDEKLPPHSVSISAFSALCGAICRQVTSGLPTNRCLSLDRFSRRPGPAKPTLQWLRLTLSTWPAHFESA
jgi:hypothetical protein